ncbi:hypothetical protein HID58_055973, partial [Brassica napus]
PSTMATYEVHLLELNVVHCRETFSNFSCKWSLLSSLHDLSAFDVARSKPKLRFVRSLLKRVPKPEVML